MALRNLKLVVRVMALLMAILVAAPASGLGQLLFFCTMTGETGSKCCCQQEVEQDALDMPSLRAVPCCELVSAKQQIPPTRVKVQAPRFEKMKAVVPPFARIGGTLVRAPTRVALPHGFRGPPPDTWPPIFIKFNSFRI